MKSHMISIPKLTDFGAPEADNMVVMGSSLLNALRENHEAKARGFVDCAEEPGKAAAFINGIRVVEVPWMPHGFAMFQPSGVVIDCRRPPRAES